MTSDIASCSKTRTVSQSARGTVQYRVQAKYQVDSATVTDHMDPWYELNPVRGALMVRLFPGDLEYGGQAYGHVIEIDEFN